MMGVNAQSIHPVEMHQKECVLRTNGEVQFFPQLYLNLFHAQSLEPRIERKMEVMIWKTNNNTQFEGFLLKIFNMHYIVYVRLLLYLSICFTFRHPKREGSDSNTETEIESKSERRV
ncbi:hypothetical protein CR513_61482, partial [Mucuna pruriens]